MHEPKVSNWEGKLLNTISAVVMIIKSLAAILVAIFLGNGAVYFFNKMPSQWFCDYDSKPTDTMLEEERNGRINGYPWKAVFTMFFVAAGIWLVKDDAAFAAAGVLTIWILLEISLGDIKYHIIPDQLVFLLIITGIGYYPYYDGWKNSLIGGLAISGIVGILALLGKLIYRRETIGGGDIKLFTALGVILGIYGIIFVFIFSTLLSGMHFSYLLITKKVKKEHKVAMAPYISIAAGIYILFLWDLPKIIISIL